MYLVLNLAFDIICSKVVQIVAFQRFLVTFNSILRKLIKYETINNRIFWLIRNCLKKEWNTFVDIRLLERYC